MECHCCLCTYLREIIIFANAKCGRRCFRTNVTYTSWTNRAVAIMSDAQGISRAKNRIIKMLLYKPNPHSALSRGCLATVAVRIQVNLSADQVARATACFRLISTKPDAASCLLCFDIGGSRRSDTVIFVLSSVVAVDFERRSTQSYQSIRKQNTYCNVIEFTLTVSIVALIYLCVTFWVFFLFLSMGRLLSARRQT
jgi:hypothetical protein